MSKRTGISLGILLLLAISLWGFRSKRSETHTTTNASNVPRKVANTAGMPDQAKSVSQNETRSKASIEKAGDNFNPRQQALESFSRKQKAAGLDTNSAPPPPPMQAYRNLPLTKSRRINGKPFQVLGARAVPRHEYSASMGDILFEQNGFAVVALAPGASQGWRDLMWNNSDRPVLVNPANGRLAIVTGTLAVKVKDMTSIERLAHQENLTVVGKDESINTVYFKPPSGYSLANGQKRLLKQADVERVELELYHSRKGPR